MSTIFISHSSKDNDRAEAMRGTPPVSSTSIPTTA